MSISLGRRRDRSQFLGIDVAMEINYPHYCVRYCDEGVRNPFFPAYRVTHHETK
jgi:hypothetical protein